MGRPLGSRLMITPRKLPTKGAAAINDRSIEAAGTIARSKVEPLRGRASQPIARLASSYAALRTEYRANLD
jgi:hypothetical protein